MKTTIADFENMTTKEFIGTAEATTIGMIIGTLSPEVRMLLEIPEEMTSIGIVSSRTGSVAQALAIDDAVKECEARLLRFEMSIDAGKQCGQGCLFVLGTRTVEDARKVVEISLDRIDYWTKCMYVNEVGHMEAHVTAKAGEVLHQIFNTPLGKPFGMLGAAPAGIGILAIDKAMKTAPIDIVWLGTPGENLRMMNECAAGLTGNFEAVKQAVEAGKLVACQLLQKCGMEPISIGDYRKISVTGDEI